MNTSFIFTYLRLVLFFSHDGGISPCFPTRAKGYNTTQSELQLILSLSTSLAIFLTSCETIQPDQDSLAHQGPSPLQVMSKRNSAWPKTGGIRPRHTLPYLPITSHLQKPGASFFKHATFLQNCRKGKWQLIASSVPKNPCSRRIFSLTYTELAETCNFTFRRYRLKTSKKENII